MVIIASTISIFSHRSTSRPSRSYRCKHATTASRRLARLGTSCSSPIASRRSAFTPPAIIAAFHGARISLVDLLPSCCTAGKKVPLAELPSLSFIIARRATPPTTLCKATGCVHHGRGRAHICPFSRLLRYSLLLLHTRHLHAKCDGMPAALVVYIQHTAQVPQAARLISFTSSARRRPPFI